MRLLRRIVCFLAGHRVVEGQFVDQGWTTAPWPAIDETYCHDWCDRCGADLPPRWVGFVFASNTEWAAS